MAKNMDIEEVEAGLRWRVTRHGSGRTFEVQLESSGINRWFHVTMPTVRGGPQTFRALVSNRQFHSTLDSDPVDVDSREAAVPRAITIAIERILVGPGGDSLAPECEVQVTSDDLREAEREANA